MEMIDGSPNKVFGDTYTKNWRTINIIYFLFNCWLLFRASDIVEEGLDDNAKFIADMMRLEAVGKGWVRVIAAALSCCFAMALHFSFSFGRSEFKAYSHIINRKKDLLKNPPESLEHERTRR